MREQTKSTSPLPWGWWLRAEAPGVVDEGGRQWASVREAFWEGRLCFAPGHTSFITQRSELMLRVLTSFASGTADKKERARDLFDGNIMFADIYENWLFQNRLLGRGTVATADFKLTDDGRSVMFMLLATTDDD